MVDSIGGGSSIARSAIEAALKRHSEAVARASSAVESPGAGAAATTDFSAAVMESLKDASTSVQRPDELVSGIASGMPPDFTEAAIALKESRLAWQFTLEVRNKFVDAYREIMRMSV
jgi:flagellar hook-basal body complex protein FliE